MAFSPSNALPLYAETELYEFQNFSFTITYTGGDEGNIRLLPVTITASEPNSTVSVSGNVISGYYSGAFPGYKIEFLNSAYEKVTVYDFKQIKDVWQVVSYTPSRVQTKTFSYTATAVDDLTGEEYSAVYQIIVTNSWDIGRQNLKDIISRTKITGRI